MRLRDVGGCFVTALSILVAAASGKANLPAAPSVKLPQAGAVNQVSTGGDLNGDGYSDLVVSRSGPGVDVYLGSATGVSTTPQWHAFGNGTPSADTFGANGGSVGDLNGDGIDDLFVADFGPNMPAGLGIGHFWVWFGRSDLATAPDGGF